MPDTIFAHQPHHNPHHSNDTENTGVENTGIERIRELEEQVAFYQSVINALPDPIFVKDESHRVILVNEAHCALVGLTADEILTTDYDDPTLPEEQNVFWQQDNLAFATDTPQENEEYLTDRQGNRHILSTRKVSHDLPNGRKILIGIIRDITARREIEKRLDHEQALLRQLIDSIPDIIFYKNMDNLYVGCNHAFEKMTGYTEADLIGKTTAAIFPEVSHQEFKQQDYLVLHEKRTIRAEQWVNYPDGRTVILDTLLTPFWSPTGESIGILGISRDITELKATEKELRAAKEAAESANHTKSTFLSTITHELRTPMNGVLGLSNLLLETDLSTEQLDLVKTIRASGNTLLTLINDILDFSKIEASKVELERYSFDLRLCLESVLDLVSAQAAMKGLTLAYLVDPEIPAYIDQDETRLRQILTNLLSNAVKFSEESEIVVYVQGKQVEKLESRDGEDPSASTNLWQLHFTVRDHGIGIPPNRIGHLFQPFSQVDNTIARRYGGTGLGLAISRRLTELMDGTMWVESEVGRGSRFHFTVMAQRSAVQHAPWIHEIATLHGHHILVIEQSAAIRGLLAQQLGLWGIDVTLQPDTTLKRLAKEVSQYDALIIGINNFTRESLQNSAPMPISQLLFLLEKTAPDLPIILLTNLGDRHELQLRQHVVATVTRPIHASQLHDALVTAFSGQLLRSRRTSDSYIADHELAKHKPLRILLAEDNVVNQKVVTGILANHGYRCDIASDGLEALDAINRQYYDLVLMDINMPEMDGITTTDIIRHSWPPARQPYIIALTANAQNGDAKHCLDVGMDDYISKPIQVKDFVQAIRRIPSKRTDSDTDNHTGSHTDNHIGTAQEDLPTKDPYDSDFSQKKENATSGQHRQLLPAAIDLTTLHEIADTAGPQSNTFLQELVMIFIESTPQLLEQLQRATNQNDIGRIGEIAHTLRSPAGQIGAEYLLILCTELESAVATNRPIQIQELVSQIIAEYERVETALQEVLKVLV